MAKRCNKEFLRVTRIYYNNEAEKQLARNINAKLAKMDCHEIAEVLGLYNPIKNRKSTEVTKYAIKGNAFDCEHDLEKFICENWSSLPISDEFDILQYQGFPIGRQYQTDTGNIDILAQSKDKSRWLVIELKKGGATDKAIAQVQRYMAFVIEQLQEEGQKVEGMIIATESDLKLQRALQVAQNISFAQYSISLDIEQKKGTA